jgi:hypothetical protein
LVTFLPLLNAKKGDFSATTQHRKYALFSTTSTNFASFSATSQCNNWELFHHHSMHISGNFQPLVNVGIKPFSTTTQCIFLGFSNTDQFLNLLLFSVFSLLYCRLFLGPIATPDLIVFWWFKNPN